MNEEEEMRDMKRYQYKAPILSFHRLRGAIP